MSPEPWSDISLFAFLARHRDIPLAYSIPETREMKKRIYLQRIRRVLNYDIGDIKEKVKGLERSHHLKGEFLDITVGTGPTAKQQMVNKALICRHSEYFRRACRSGFRESFSGKFQLPDVDPIAFEFFLTWLDNIDIRPASNPHDKRKLDNFVGDNLVHTWIRGKEVVVPLFLLRWIRSVKLEGDTTNICLGDHLLDIWILSDWLVAPSFSRIALGLITWAEQLDSDFLIDVYENTIPESPLRLYIDQFVRHYPRSIGSETDGNAQMYADLKQDTEESDCKDPDSIGDPRGLPVEHWYSECGKSSKSCIHSRHLETLYPDEFERTAAVVGGHRMTYPLSLYLRC